jgi:hypothetical protein
VISQRHALLVAILMFAVVSAWATPQITTADVVGRVTDSTGAVVPGATVTLTNLGTNIARSVVADERGRDICSTADPVRAEAALLI